MIPFEIHNRKILVLLKQNGNHKLNVGFWSMFFQTLSFYVALILKTSPTSLQFSLKTECSKHKSEY